MASTATLLSRRLRALGRLVRQDGGMAAVEFALILPILVMLWIGGVEMTQALSIDRRLNNLASAIGDLSARSKKLSYDDIANIMNIAPGAMYPYCKTKTECLGKGLTMRITAVDIDSSGNTTLGWSQAQGTSAFSGSGAGAELDSLVPESLRVPDSQIIMAEVTYSYTPAVGYVLTGTVPLDDRMFFVPRLTQFVKLCQNDDENDCIS